MSRTGRSFGQLPGDLVHNHDEIPGHLDELPGHLVHNHDDLPGHLVHDHDELPGHLILLLLQVFYLEVEVRKFLVNAIQSRPDHSEQY